MHVRYVGLGGSGPFRGREAALPEEAAAGGEQEREGEEARRSEDDGGGGGDVGVVGDVEPGQRGQDADESAHRHHRRQAARQELGGGGRRHQQRHDEHNTHGLKADHGRHAYEGEEAVLDGRHRQAGGRRHRRVVGHEKDLLVEQHYEDEDDGGEGGRGPDVVPADREDVAEYKGEQVSGIVPLRADDHHAKGERAHEQDADGGIVLDEAAAGDEADEEGGDDGGNRSAQVEVRAQHERYGDAAETGVGQGVADERHPLQDHEAPNHRGDGADDHRRKQGAPHELKRPRVPEKVGYFAHGPMIVVPWGSTNRCRWKAALRFSSVKTSAGRPKAMTRRFRRTTWSKSAATQERSWVATNSVFPSRRSSSNRRRRSCFAVASRPASGSSSKTLF